MLPRPGRQDHLDLARGQVGRHHQQQRRLRQQLPLGTRARRAQVKECYRLWAKYLVGPRLREFFQASEVVCHSRNKIRQTWGPFLSPPLHCNGQFNANFQPDPGRRLLRRFLRGVQGEEADPPGGRVRLLIVTFNRHLSQNDKF